MTGRVESCQIGASSFLVLFLGVALSSTGGRAWLRKGNGVPSAWERTVHRGGALVGRPEPGRPAQHSRLPGKLRTPDFLAILLLMSSA